MEGAPFEDASFGEYSNQPLPSLNSTLLQNKNQDNLNVHSIQVMLGLHQQQDMFGNMRNSLGEYNKGSPQKIEGAMQHKDLGLFQQGMEDMNGAVKKKGSDMLLQSQNLSSTDMGNVPSSTQKKNDKKKNDNNGVKKKKTRYVTFNIEILLYTK